MELERLQQYLKNMHKFDRKKTNEEYTEDIKKRFDRILPLIRRPENGFDVELCSLVVELIQLANILGFDLEKVIKDKLKYGL